MLKYIIPPLNTHADIPAGPRSLNSDLSLHLPPYFVYTRKEGSGENLGGRDGGGRSRAMKISCFNINIIIVDSDITVFQCA